MTKKADTPEPWWSLFAAWPVLWATFFGCSAFAYHYSYSAAAISASIRASGGLVGALILRSLAGALMRSRIAYFFSLFGLGMAWKPGIVRLKSLAWHEFSHAWFVITECACIGLVVRAYSGKSRRPKDKTLFDADLDAPVSK